MTTSVIQGVSWFNIFKPSTSLWWFAPSLWVNLPSAKEVTSTKQKVAEKWAKELGDISESEKNKALSLKNSGKNDYYIADTIKTSRELGKLSDSEASTLAQVKSSWWDVLAEAKKILASRNDTISNIGEWLASFAWGIPKAISETGILDKPAEMLAKWVASWLSKVTGKNFKLKENAQSFSELAKWSQVWGDPESDIAKNVETWLNVAEFAVAPATALKWLAKKTAIKEWVLDLIGAKWNQKQMAEAIAEWRVSPWATWIKKFLFWSKPKVIEKWSIQEAGKTILKEIKNPAYDKPTVLYDQIDNLIETKARWISNELKWLKIWSFTKDKANATKLIQDWIVNNSAVNKLITPKEINNIKSAVQSIKSAKTADELWNARKLLDLATPDSVKKATSVSSDILQYRKAIWSQARWEINDLIEKSAEKYGKKWVKDTFKSMSQLYQAQDNILSKAWQLIQETQWLLSKWNIKKAAIWWLGLYAGNKIVDSF